MHKVLEGLKVVELSTYVAVPKAARMMADWGAEVIKVEPPGGEAWRWMGRVWGLPAAEDNNPLFHSENANKKSLSLDLKKEAGKDVSAYPDPQTAPKGLNEGIIRMISAKKNEPDWLLEFRLQAYRHWLTMTEPQWPNVNYPKIDFQAISYYAAPKPKKKLSMDEVDPELLKTFEKLGVPMHERAALAGVAVDVIFDSVSVTTTYKEKLAEVGIIFCSISEAVHNHPELVRQVITLGTPFGDPRAVVVYPLMQRIHGKPMGERELDEWLAMCRAPLSSDIPLSIIYSRSDGFVAPHIATDVQNSHIENIHIHSSHVGLTVNPLSLFVIADRLVGILPVHLTVEEVGVLRC